MDFRLNEEICEEDILKALENKLPEGIEVYSAKEPDYSAKDIAFAEYEITLYSPKDEILKALEEYQNNSQAVVTKVTKRGQKDINLKEYIKEIKITEASENSVTFTALYPSGLTFNVNPSLLLDYLCETYGIAVLDALVIRKKLLDENLIILQ